MPIPAWTLLWSLRFAKELPLHQKEGWSRMQLSLTSLKLWWYPYHHCGMAGTIIMPEDVVRETMINVMYGLWNDGFRKQMWVNNHGQLWILESALQEFVNDINCLAFIGSLIHRAIREFFIPIDREDSITTDFIHADES